MICNSKGFRLVILEMNKFKRMKILIDNKQENLEVTSNKYTSSRLEDKIAWIQDSNNFVQMKIILIKWISKN